MLRVVLDTNVLVSAILKHGGNEWNILQKVSDKKIVSLTSEDMLHEFARVMSKPRFENSKEEVDEWLLFLARMSYLVIPAKRLNVIRDDPSDNKILECAVCGNAHYIISGDKHLLDLGEYKDIKVLNSSDFLKSSDI
ncbi:MAG: putative toxin-antitoxin system toxin component, PIN family [Candidatus Altiarchaeales archaeon]|nr:putative toxin-antitoxin system toxin component, PIN family [Candidatus Altiarchaeota archaeon]MCG2782629.1 putative toxin-antitoxin system toxin component, PIN family [Candidatus Altiarchaeales archaeon]MBU4266827.1 putative toxin-antitoxin system toxin component, PIN family [Candidatus Altiarchaeota archaeon]MBU4342240.1 putative toxin-antitoxin system toxin component, PIN family [Candidatus Altiarchaeota archaeon]MBU4406802.1 putative toxin-antitoxin system toxin component, PIN family [Ca